MRSKRIIRPTPINVVGIIGVVIALLGSTLVAAPTYAKTESQGCIAENKVTEENALNRRQTIVDAINAMLNDRTDSRLVAQTLWTRYRVKTLTSTTGAGVSPSSSGNDVSVYAPQIIYDTCSGKYTAYASYSWNSIVPLANETFCSGTCNVGGYDSFGITFSRPVASVSGYAMYTQGNTSQFPYSSGRMWVEDGNLTGVSYIGQDQLCEGASCLASYSFYYGTLYYFIGSPGCGTLQAFAKLGHTWSSTSISSVDVSAWNISISFTSSSNRFPVQGDPSNAVSPC